MLRNIQLMKVDLSCNKKLKDKRTGDIIGLLGFLNVEGNIVDVEYQDVSNLPDEVELESPSQELIDGLEAYFNEMFEQMMKQDV